ncbi:replication protein A [Natrialba magadii ATCC 43099]|uniref:OB-fold tRNA/helicase-type nucleic acid binding protein n=1 Tax=Natrialba magadii (strain ATCC 43099 / DSM 3394 / CCM 3739 / CIP 104546 / IAM 13178 / JCM 8861 / NBRC 102185 / NCIMB 2190 / MS3) TaxID=547559 RepID=D3SWQ5_NATMM|nr:replication protein A [Natrialba magadii]ADD05787.1 replication protein A [Natrialba magadii ATCC 43099]ELY30138.1 OB-fold tRNA/helicase-type nucleic acid binding protein [Natrialba magadii ATCC 43099]
MSDVRQHADDIHDQFSDHLDVSVEDVEERLATLVDEYKVPMDEARRSVTNHYLEEAGLDREDLSSGSSEAVNVEDVDEPEEWVDLTAKVIELWDPRSDSVAQVGLLGDPTGTIKFTKWAKSELPALEEGGVYSLQNVVTDEYQGRYSVKLNSTTIIEELDEELEVGDDTSEIEGALVDMQSGSGLIKRCPKEDCTRVLQNGRCNEHGEVEGEFDLRIKAVVDDGLDAHEVIFDKEATEELTGLSLEEAKDMAMDALDTTVVADEIADDIVGTYYRIEGPTFGRYVLADDVSELDGPADAEQLLIKARSM